MCEVSSSRREEHSPLLSLILSLFKFARASVQQIKAGACLLSFRALGMVGKTRQGRAEVGR
jgi:hypothetical protein